MAGTLHNLNNIRAFIAVDVSVKDAIKSLQQELLDDAGWTPQQAKPVEIENFHITLFFLGNIPSEVVEKVKTKIAEVEFDPIDITFTGIGAFPYPTSPRIIWVGVGQGAQELVCLAEDVVQKLSEIGFKPDRPFSPHLTVLRIKANRLKMPVEILTKFMNKCIASDIINELHLKRSDPVPSGVLYTDIFTVYAR